jgi:hypothetical protein
MEWNGNVFLTEIRGEIWIASTWLKVGQGTRCSGSGDQDSSLVLVQPNKNRLLTERVARRAAVDWDTALQAERSWVRFPMMSLEFTIAPGVDSASNINEYRGCLLWCKSGRCVGLTLPPSCAECPEILGASVSWKPKAWLLPSFSAPVQTGPGTHPASYTVGTGGKAAGVWRWPSTLI